MALYLISYDLHLHRDYAKVHELMETWRAAKLLESLWLAELRGPADAIRDFVLETLDADDSVIVIRQDRQSQWATIRGLPAGVAWLWRNMPSWV